MGRSNEYTFLLEWLVKEPNVDLVIPYIKELLGQIPTTRDIVTDLRKEEISRLRSMVVMIKEKGHSEFCKSMTQAIFAADEVFEGVRVI